MLRDKITETFVKVDDFCNEFEILYLSSFGSESHLQMVHPDNLDFRRIVIVVDRFMPRYSKCSAFPHLYH